MTKLGKFTQDLKELPSDLSELVPMQRLAIHEYVASAFYGVNIPDDRKNEESHIREFSQMLENILIRNRQSLSTPRNQKIAWLVCVTISLYFWSAY